MKRIIFILLPVIFFSCSKNKDNTITPVSTDSLATGWRKIIVPELQRGSDIFFVNNTTGFLVGDNFIRRSNDGGNTWQKVYQSLNTIENIAMGSALNAIFVTVKVGSGPSKIITTFDGGNTFDSVTLADDNITDAFFVSSSVAYAIGQKCWKTINGGRTWNSTFDFGTTIPSGYRSFHFLNEQTGWWAGSGGIFKTGNAGINWDSQSVPPMTFTTLNTVFFADANTGYISSFNGIGKSTNGGATWTKIYTLESSLYHDLYFLTPAIGYLTDEHYIRKTVDGGNTWNREVKLVSGDFIELHFTDADHGWACGDGQYILKYEK